MIKVHLDFETRSVLSVVDVGPWRYSLDPSTTVLCLCYRVEYPNGQTFHATITKELFNSWFDNHIMSCVYPDDRADIIAVEKIIDLAKNKDVRFFAHNSMFEYCMWNNILAKAYGFPELKDFNRWECTASKAAAHALPRALGKCAIALHLTQKKDETGKRIMMKMSKPKKISAKDKTIWNDKEEDYKVLYDYCEQDVVVESAIDNALPPLIPLEREVWKLDQIINARGVNIDRAALDKAIKFVTIFKDKLNNELLDLTSGAVSKATEVAKLTRYIRDFVDETELPNLNATNITEYLKVCTDSKIRRILEIRQQAGKSSTSKLETMKLCICPDGNIRDILMYHGASTGRWSGKGIQVQNFPRGDKSYDSDKVIEDLKTLDYDTFEFIYPNVVDAISTALRGFIKAEDGEDLIAADFSAIEARVVLWLAGAEKGLKAFREGADIYCELASEIYKRKITKKDKDERQLGKTGVLGCGYQMGPDRFKAQVKTQTGLDISRETADLVVKTYRATYPEVVAFWYAQERAAIRAVREAGRIIKEGPVMWKVQGKFLYCRLLSGRCIAYCEPVIKPIETKWGEIKEQLTFMAENPVTRKWERQHTYGGAIVENIVQATARDLMAWGMLNLEKHGYKIRMTVHDEVVASCKKGAGDVKEFEKLLCTTPEWATTCPIVAEGWIGERYRK